MLRAVEGSAGCPAALLITDDLAEAGPPAAFQRLRTLVEPLVERIGTLVIYAAGNHPRQHGVRRTEPSIGIPG